MDTIGNFLTTIRNASNARLAKCVSQWSKVRESIAKILLNEGFISDYKTFQDENGHKRLELTLKYLRKSGAVKIPAIVGIERQSTPGCRLYVNTQSIPRVLDGLGIAIITTSKGIMQDKEARRQGVGGELICKVW